MAGIKGIFRSFQVVPHYGTGDVGGYDLFWKFQAPGAEVTSFLVEIGETDNGPWMACDLQPGTNQFLLEAATKQLAFGTLRWFRVTALAGTTPLGQTPPMDARNALNRRDYLYYRDLLRRWRLQLEKYSGSPGYLLQRRTYGTLCKCADPILKQTASSECKICYGTSITGGYFTAVKMFCEWHSGPPRPNTIVQAQSGPTSEQKSEISVMPFPEVRSDDVWVDRGTRLRYLVETSRVEPQFDYRGSAVRRELTLNLQPPKHPIYNFPLPTES